MARWGFRQQGENRLQQVQFNAIGVPTQQDSLHHQLSLAGGAVAAGTVPAGLRQALRNYLETQDSVSLYRARSQYPDYRLERLLDRNSQRAFLLVYQRQGNRIALGLNLSAHDISSSITVPRRLDQTAIEGYVESGAAWLELGDAS